MKILEKVVIKFAGDSGDGMQFVGNRFTEDTAVNKYDFATFPNYPAEIRAPQGTLPGVSGFQLQFGSIEITTPGDQCDVLVAMNAASLKTSLHELKPNGIIIANESGFDSKNLKLSKTDSNPLDNGSLDAYQLYVMDISKLTQESLANFDTDKKQKDLCKNMFVLGFILWLYNRNLTQTTNYIEQKFAKNPLVRDMNVAVLKSGYNYGITTNAFQTQFEIKEAQLPKGTYRYISGNQAAALGLMMASNKSNLPLFYGSYPITPASDILHELAKHTENGVFTFQAEDEIAAVSAAIGASFGGNLAVTGTSGPGMALKAEAINLALMLELPLVIINVQRGGPSTGMPTKTEQADLLQAMFGRNGESPLPIIAAKSPSDCFNTAMEACKLSIETMTPVIMLSDGYLANGSEPWKIPEFENIQDIEPRFASAEEYIPYKRNENLIREWAIPGMKGKEHRLGGLEKELETGNVSYNPANHQAMVTMRQEKVNAMANRMPLAEIETGVSEGDVLIIGWGSTYGTIKKTVNELTDEGYKVGHLHLRHINPFPKNLNDIFSKFNKWLVPEMNMGQLSLLLRNKYLLDFKSFNKVQGVPIYVNELKQAIIELINE